MEGYINEDRWIDLSGLPRMHNNSNSGIDWQRTAGSRVQFKYDNVNGYIYIIKVNTITLSNNKHKSTLLITIDKYVEELTEIPTNTLIYCKLHQYVSNKIADFAPHIIKYLANPTDAFHYTCSSNKYILTKCPVCGYEEYKRIGNLCRCGFSCLNCNDGISMPNKIMRDILNQCKIRFIPEVNKKDGFEWMQQYRYDFYFQTNDHQHVLIEMDGGFHRFQHQKEIDAIKTSLAKDNKFKLIRIDCHYNNNSPFDYLKKQIINSELQYIIPLYLIDWDCCKKSLNTSLLTQVCQLWERDKLSIARIKSTLQLSSSTVERYLNFGQEVGICTNYNKKEVYNRRDDEKQIPIMVIDSNNNMHMFSCTKEAVDLFDLIFNITASKSGLNTACRNNRKYKGLQVKYITKKEYEQYKMNTKNIEVVKEVA